MLYLLKGDALMIINEIEKNFYKYMFEPKQDNKYGYNIYILVDEKSALMIDAGYRMHCSSVIEDLESKGIKIVKVIISHFHIDHINGINELPGVEIVGSSDYEKTLEIYIDADSHHIYTPVSYTHLTLPTKRIV